MRVIARKPLRDIRSHEEQLKAKDAQLQKLGFSLAEEKIKSTQKDIMIQNIGQQLAQIKIDVAKIKGDE